MGSVCHGYLCILLYLNLFGVVVLHRSLVDERRGWGQSAVGSVCTGVVVFHQSMVDWRRGWGLSALLSVHSAICETYLV